MERNRARRRRGLPFQDSKKDVTHHRNDWSLFRYGSVLIFVILIGYQYGTSTVVIKSRLMEINHLNQPNLNRNHVGRITSIPTLNETRILIKTMPINTHEPPNVVELHDKSLPVFVQHRHTCISHIRKTHFRTLGLYLRSDTNRTIYLDPAYHENIGDTMLSMATHWFFAQLNQETMPCHCLQALVNHPTCDEHLFDKAQAQNYRVAAWHPGGK